MSLKFKIVPTQSTGQMVEAFRNMVKKQLEKKGNNVDIEIEDDKMVITVSKPRTVANFLAPKKIRREDL